MKAVEIQVVNRIACVTLCRHEAANAFNFDVFDGLIRAQKRVRKDRTIRAVVIASSGKDFSTGLDVRKLMTSPKALLRLGWKWLPGQANLAQKVSVGWRDLPVPVIAAIHGRCWGAGLQLALGCDLRIAEENSELCFLEAKWGMIPDMGGSLGLPSLLSQDIAFRMTALAEKIDAQTAKKEGLVTEVVPDARMRAHELASEFAGMSPTMISATKKLYQKAWCTRRSALLSLEFFSQLRLLLGSDRKDALRKQLNQQKKKTD